MTKKHKNHQNFYVKNEIIKIKILQIKILVTLQTVPNHHYILSYSKYLSL